MPVRAATSRRVALVVAGAVVLSVTAAGGLSRDGRGDAEAAPLTLTRVAGVDRYETAATLALRTVGRAETVVLASGQDFPDALAASYATAVLGEGVPVLLTAPQSTPGTVRDALTRLGATRVVVLGGSTAVSDEQVAALDDAGYAVQRVSGPDRYATAAEVARLAGGPRRQVFLATGLQFADALAAGPLSHAERIPVLLTEPTALPEPTLLALDRLAVEEVLLLGGPAAVDPAVEEALRARGLAVRRLAGPSRAATAVAVARLAREEAGMTTPTVGLVTGLGFADALVAASTAGRSRYPLLLSESPPRLGDATTDYLRGNPTGVTGIVAFGGEAAISPGVLEQARVAVTGEAAPQQLAAGEPTVVAAGFDSPWGLAVLPDGALLVGERDTALVKRVEPDGRVSTVGVVPGVVAGGEGGLLGLTPGPTYAVDRAVYAYTSTATDNRVVRFPVGIGGGPDRELGPVLDVLTGIPRGPVHDGGRVVFGPDRRLYVSTGDAAEPERAADPASLAGKVLRLTPDGLVPGDNPTPGSPVFTLGHRNVQGLAFDPVGRLWASELGQDTADEVNLLRGGEDYGWPRAEGAGGGPGATDPLVTWSPAEASPSGAAVAGGSLWVAALRGERLWQVPLTGGGTVGEPAPLFAGRFGRLRTVEPTADGSGLWVLTDEGSASRLLRVPLG